jgi:hypothetical protein
MHSIPFAQLLKDPAMKDRETFCARFEFPALVVEELGGRPPSEVDGRTPFVLPNWWRPTPQHVGRTAVLSHPLHRYGNVIWLAKSPRNPFQNLITIGRAPNNDIRLPLESLSKLHATFTWSGERWQVQDHSSRNGTFLNEERLPPNKTVDIADGDQLRFCPELKTSFFAPGPLYDFVALIGRIAPSE